jgi:peptidoglycan/xylan/chitin deacetylase (PgdA/CDA1 family)
MLHFISKLIKVLVVVAAVLGIFIQYKFKDDYNDYKKHAIPYLMYHSIGIVPGWDKDVCIPEELFKEHLQYFHDNGYRIVSAAEARNMLLAGENVEKTVAMTFDDGYNNNYTAAYPLLKQYGYHATFFVIGNSVGAEDYMTFEQLKEMHDNGMEIGSHSMSHDPLNIIALHYLPWEIYQPINVVHQHLGFYIEGLAYPNGAYNAAVLAEIHKYPRLKYALTGKAGCNTQKLVKEKPFELRRMGIYDNGNGITGLKRRLEKAYLVGYLESKGFPTDWLYKLTLPKI